MVTVNSNDELLKKCSYVAISSYRRKVLETLKNDVKIPTKISEILNNFEEALAVIDEGLKISPDDDSIYATKAMILLRAHKYDEGIECVNKALKLNPSNVIALKLRNNVLKGNLRWNVKIICN